MNCQCDGGVRAHDGLVQVSATVTVSVYIPNILCCQATMTSTTLRGQWPAIQEETHITIVLM